MGPITDGSDRIDYEMARGYLARHYQPLQVEAEIVRFRAAADRLVVSEQRRITTIANALLKFGTLSGEEIFEISSGSPTCLTAGQLL